MSKVIRSVKNVTKGYSSVQVKVRNATSNDPWGPTGTEMSEIAQMTFASSNEFHEIMDMLDKRLNDKGKNWRHVLKALKVLDYCLHEGSEQVVTWARKNAYIVRTLGQFQYIDEDGRDVGQNVRVSAKELTALIQDDERLRTERQDRKIWKSRVTGIEEYGPQSSYGEDGSSPPRRRMDRRDRRADEEDAEYKLAIEASKYEAEEDRKRRERSSAVPDDDDLAKAIKLSKEEEELRRRELEESNPSAVFDDAPAPPTAQPQLTGYNQGYQQQSAVDWEGNTIDQQPGPQVNMTGYLNSAYSNPTGFQAQPTGYQGGGGGYPNGYPTSPGVFDPQAFSQPGQTPGFLQPQSTNYAAFHNPYMPTGAAMAGGQAEQQPMGFLATGSNNPWASTQAQSSSSSSLDALKPLPTGSNNPFASSLNRPQPHAANTAPTLNTLVEQKVQTQFNNHNFNPATSFLAPNVSPPKEQNPQHARLNALLATGEGMDTFGNTGDLRIPAQHTAPGTFVNSAGHSFTRLTQSQTGNNPFFQQQQQQQQPSFSSSQSTAAPFASPNNNPPRLVPAQTGPAHMNGFSGGGGGGGVGGMGSYGGAAGVGNYTNNPFGAQQRPPAQPYPQGGSLIDL